MCRDHKLEGKNVNISLIYDTFGNLREKLNLIQEQHSSDDSSFSKGICFGFEIVLCHNDLLGGNILLDNDTPVSDLAVEPKIYLIDYEYTSYNHRAFDIGNHFNGSKYQPSNLFFYILRAVSHILFVHEY